MSMNVLVLRNELDPKDEICLFLEEWNGQWIRD